MQFPFGASSFPCLIFMGPDCLTNPNNSNMKSAKTVSTFYSKTNQMHQCIKFILFWNDTLHVSGDLFIHHQEFKTVHTATKQILLTASKQSAVSVWLLYVQS